jgi:cell division transport system permease protein
MSEFKEKNNQRKSRNASASRIISISLVLLMLGVLSLIIIKSHSVSTYLKENIGFTIMLKEPIKEIEVLKFQKKLETTKWAKSIKYVSKNEAAKILESDLGENFISFLGYNPLSSSIDIQLQASYANLADINAIKLDVKKDDVVKDVFFQDNLVTSINRNLEKVSALLLGFSLLLFIISIALINNTIRISIYSKRFLIRTMKLVGAENRFIRKPFLYKSIIQGLYSGLITIILLLLLLVILDKTIPELVLKKDLDTIGLIFIFILAIGVSISWLATYIAITKYLKMNNNDLYK